MRAGTTRSRSCTRPPIACERAASGSRSRCAKRSRSTMDWPRSRSHCGLPRTSTLSFPRPTSTRAWRGPTRGSRGISRAAVPTAIRSAISAGAAPAVRRNGRGFSRAWCPSRTRSRIRRVLRCCRPCCASSVPKRRPCFALPAPPRGDAVRVAIYEYEIDPVGRRGCHDLEIGPDGVVYTADGFTVDPGTLERGHHPIPAGAHSIEQDAAGNMWITITGSDRLARIDARTKRVDVFDQPGGQKERGIYPHTLSFDKRGRIWFTLTGSNHVGRFDPDSGKWTYYRLPDESDIGGPWNEQWPWGPTPIPYGLEVAPDQGVWWSQLLGPRIGRVDPETGKVESWKPPFDGPRRLSIGPDNVVWVPGYGSSELGRFDP